MKPSAAQLARMRGRQEETMTDSCVIRRRTGRGNDGAGGRTAGTIAQASVPCRVAPMSLQREQQYAQRLAGSVGLTVTIPIDTTLAGGPLKSTDEIELNDGRKLNILGFEGPHTRQTAERIHCGVASA